MISATTSPGVCLGKMAVNWALLFLLLSMQLLMSVEVVVFLSRSIVS